jgi:olfactory receptor
MNKIITLIYSVVTPALNPFIYSLRNKDMKYALHHVFFGNSIMQNL